MTTPPTPEQLAGIVARHEESGGSWPDRGHVCLTCWQDWPCDAVQVLALLRETAGELRRIAYSQESDLSVYAKFAESVAKEALAALEAVQ